MKGEKQTLLALSPKLFVQSILLCKIIGCLTLLSSEYNFDFSFLRGLTYEAMGFILVSLYMCCYTLLKFVHLPVKFATIFNFHVFCGKVEAAE